MFCWGGLLGSEDLRLHVRPKYGGWIHGTCSVNWGGARGARVAVHCAAPC